MKQNKNAAPVDPAQRLGARHIHQWLVAFAPPLLITLCAVTLFRAEIVRSIASSAHPAFVYAILTTFFVGLVFCALALQRFQREAIYIQVWQAGLAENKGQDVPLGHSDRVSVSLALSALGLKLQQTERQSRFELEVSAVSNALGEKLSYANYIAGALIGLGLVGTFVGLLGTLEDLGAVFSLLGQSGDSGTNPTAVFSNMVTQLQEPMKGMGTAFVSSLYGLLGSLLLGLCALSVSKAGDSVIKDLQDAGRAHALHFADAEVTIKPQEKHPLQIEQLQHLLEQMLEAQLGTENRLSQWLEHGENRLVQMLAQTLQAHWAASSDIQAKHQQVIDQLSALVGTHGENAQSLSAHIADQDRHLTQSMRELADRAHSDQSVLRDELMGAVERANDDRRQQADAIFSAILNVTTLTERSNAILIDHLQKQAQFNSQALRPVAAAKTWGSLGAADKDAPPEGWRLLAQSIDRQTRLLEELVRKDEPATESNHSA